MVTSGYFMSGDRLGILWRKRPRTRGISLRSVGGSSSLELCLPFASVVEYLYPEAAPLVAVAADVSDNRNTRSR